MDIGGHQLVIDDGYVPDIWVMSNLYTVAFL